ncbi:MAG: hypothetical protein VX733_11690 [Candidatus Latescibacterota bacterium]|nr:hypothetical protein [Candidatus Latescibacterota bacterium]
MSITEQAVMGGHAGAATVRDGGDGSLSRGGWKFRWSRPLCQRQLRQLAMLCVVWSSAHQTGVEATSDLVVMENDYTRIAIAPRDGAAIVQYLDRRSGVEFSTASVRPAGPGIRDLTLGLHQVAHRLERRRGAGYQAVVTRAIAPGVLRDGGQIVGLSPASTIAVEREMRLADGSTKLTVNLRYTNIGQKPQPLWIRWQPYLVLDDPYGEHSVIVAPGPEPGQMRRIRVGLGRDSHFLNVPGYWLALNSRTGNGMWMTFRESHVQVCATWTDARHHQHPERGWFTVEPRQKKRLLRPGETVEMEMTYQPFTNGDRLDLGLVQHVRQAQARRFAQRVRDNAAIIAGHTMVPWPNEGPTSEAQSRFYFNNLRRDRFALTDVAIVDGLMAIPGIQSLPLRMRHYARLYDSVYDSTRIRYQLTVTDIFRRISLQREWEYTLNPFETRTLDRRIKLALEELEDGRYTFALDVYLDEDEAPVHSYTENRVLVGRERAATAEARRSAGPASERPFVAALRASEISDDGSVPIGVEEVAGVTRVDWPLRVGVPFAQGALPPEQRVALTDALGRVLPTQTKVLGTWPDGSARWVLVDFQSDVVGAQHSFLRLTVDGSDGSVGEIPSLASRQGNRVEVDSGSGVWQFEADGTIIGLLRPEDLWWKTGAGRIYRFRVKGEDAGIRIVENGPLRCRVRISGWYLPEDVDTGAEDERRDQTPVARGQIDAEFYRGNPFFRLYHTYTYTGDPWEDTLAGTGIRFRSPDPFWKQAAVAVDGDTVSSDSLVIVQQLDDRHAAVATSRSSQYGKRSTGTALLRKKELVLVIHHRDFWRLFPKQVEASVDEGTLTYHYWPEEAGTLDWRPREDGMLTSSSAPTWALAVGVSRTHEFLIDPAGWYELPRYEEVFDEPVVCAVPPQYLTDTGVLMHLQPYDPDVHPEIEAMIAETLDSYLLNQQVYRWYGQWVWGSLPNTYRTRQGRWENHGRYGHLLNEQNVAHVPWLAFLRSGDRRYLKLAEANTRHLLEVGTIAHDPRDPSSGGLSRRHHECIWLSPGDSGHSMIDPFLEMYHVTGYLPAWEASQDMVRAMAHPGAAFYDYGWRYLANPIAALARMHLETQEPGYREQADALWQQYARPDRGRWFVGDHGARMVQMYGQLSEEVMEHWVVRTDAEGEERAFHHLDALAALYESTNDPRYARAMLPVFQAYVARAQKYDPERVDPLLWGIAYPTQHILAGLREMMYASRALKDATGR